MIIDAPRLTREQYNKIKSNYYEKPGIPEIELKLQAHQERVLIDGDYTHLKEFKADVQVYVRSLILKRLNGGTDYIDETLVDSLSSEAADNFLKRYFRSDSPAIGASFAGVLDFKAREVLSNYFKQDNIESKISLDDVLSGSDEGRAASFEDRLAYLQYIKSKPEEYDKVEEIENFLSKVDAECEKLDMIPSKELLSDIFLEYLIYLVYLQSTREDKKLSSVSTIALGMLGDDKSKDLTPILESALLDIIES